MKLFCNRFKTCQVVKDGTDRNIWRLSLFYKAKDCIKLLIIQQWKVILSTQARQKEMASGEIRTVNGGKITNNSYGKLHMWLERARVSLKEKQGSIAQILKARETRISALPNMGRPRLAGELSDCDDLPLYMCKHMQHNQLASLFLKL